MNRKLVKMRYLPIHLDTAGKTIIVIGGGAAAEAKLRTLLKSEADIRVFSASPSSEIQKWERDGTLSITNEQPNDDEFSRSLLVYAASEDPVENAYWANMARGLGVFVNAADQKAECDFFTPALVDRSPVTISVGTEGTSPGLARAIKSDLESRLPQALGSLAIRIQSVRDKLKQIMPNIADRQRLWGNILSGKDLGERLNELEGSLDVTLENELAQRSSNEQGYVSLVGAGPGDPSLLTIAARQKLHIADVIVYDRLVSHGVLDLARREAEYIYVGKEPGKPSIKQDQINDILIQKAKEGLHIVRLKSGDPLIFGRADEEIQALENANITIDIVPGITASSAAAADIGLSLTSRGLNKSVTFITGQDAKGFAEHDWEAIAKQGARVAIYMGVGASRFIQGRILLHGGKKDLPITVVENASRENKIILPTTLDNLPQDIENIGIKGPAILLIGYDSNKNSAKRHNGLGVAI